MNCPSCEKKLSRTQYAGTNVRHCDQCQGVLLKSSRANKIERRVNKDVDELEKEIRRFDNEDTIREVRCPACRDKMDKLFVKKLEFYVDNCGQCGMSWFDGGELASLQLAYENKPQAKELARMRNRLKNMTDEERLEYETDLQNLRDLGSSMGQAARGATFVRAQHFFRMSVG